MSEIWEQELDDHESGCECCDICDSAIHNGEAYYDINGAKVCESCMDTQYKRIMDYDYKEEYTREDYLTEEYERRRHDG